LLTSASVRQAISDRASVVGMSRAAGAGFTTMRRDGILKAARGVTTIHEVLTATQDADEGRA
jgi:type II secretory ATPase GspE/PulE/Tfp pilus assembly ATPase PilB-like protein